ncbi:NB-ARC domain disease resistance protein [Medicago truncatula]|uniref:NB-ARC domain disease resistance protein n=1 Tax=Medicago truncatula TaxID=3880 RepID=G7KSN1_MEDTR|nr:NB-ARC domain disease resistance protein [Medicago truncatula]
MTSAKVILLRSFVFSKQARDASYLSGTITKKNSTILESVNPVMQPHPHGDGDGDKSLCVIPIVGIGGLGKTTLAKLVFNDKRVNQLFQLKMWLCVSNEFDIRQIIIKIINSGFASTFTSSPTPTVSFSQQENINNLDIVQLMTYGMMDDRSKWIELKDLIKVGTVECKIIVTTRSKSIASMTGTVPSYLLHGLSKENSLSLFVKSAFKEGEEEKYPNLVKIAKEIVKKCQGVPLAVKTLGSSLFSKFDLNKWEFVRDSEIWNLEQKQNDILPALKLSYDQMPSYLRHCFAYFSLYPKDYTFRDYRCSIAKLWVALGLVESRNGSENMENISREYIV